jgi:flagellar basal-body rod modification protein FlgD
MTSTSTLSGLVDTSAAAGFSNTGTKDSAKELNDRFLKLLVAQMNNQDPLNPLDNAQVTSQMAQINTVTGINGLNDTVSQLLNQFTRLETMQAAQLAGRNVLVAGNTMSLAPATADAPASAAAGFSLDLPAEKVKVEILDANGAVVRTLQLGAKGDGIAQFKWDGRTDAGSDAPAGNYTFKVTATVAGKEAAATALAVRRVEGVRQEGNSVQLILAGGVPVAYADIKQIL